MESVTFYEQLTGLEREGTAFVLVILADALGSTPQDRGAKMLVTQAGLFSGTIGGGKVEAKALALAREIIDAKESAPRFENWALKTDVGMTCGGSVKLYFEPHVGGGVGAKWPVWIFGAGHVVQALVPVLAPLDCQITVVDPRREWLDRLPRARNARYLEAAEPSDLISQMPDHAFLLCLTKGHAFDRPVLQRALTERNFPFVGVIGSDAKAEVLRREMIASGLPAERAQQFHCPVGLTFGNNQPVEIALSITAQLLTERDKLASPLRATSRMKPWKKLSSRDVLRDRWVRLRADRVELPSGKAIEPYYVMEESEWVHVCALNAKNEILLGRQYRYAGEAFGYELPGGTTDAGEDLMLAAQRELLDETGVVADNWRHICGLLTNPARTNNRIHCFLAENARVVQAPQLEETEDIVVEWVSFSRALELIRTGEINQAMHIAMLHQVFQELGWIKPIGPV